MMMLLNGGVLGLVHRDLPRVLRPSADSWRTATLLMAGGSVLLAVQAHYPPGFILPLANGLMMAALTLYWRALRQFYGLPDHWTMLLPSVVAVAGICWFSAVQPDPLMRMIVATAGWLVVLSGAVRALHAGRGERALSRRVMLAVFLVVGLFTASRVIWFAVLPEPSHALLDPRSLINVVTPLAGVVLAVIGTTVFLLMCSERISRHWEQAASTDHLTGLANRRTLAAEGERRLRAQRDAAGLAVAIIDIDHFKRINDVHGHAVGDLALRHVAGVLRQVCRDGDLAARHGGEEFVVLSAGGDPETLAERLRSAVAAAPFPGVAGGLAITVSIGVTRVGAGDGHLDDLLRRADRALYRAKAGGRDRVESEPVAVADPA